MTPHGEFIRVTTTVALLEKLLPGARFFAFAHNATTIYRDLDYTLPAALHRVASVTDVNYLPTPPTRVQFQMSTARSLGDGNVSPSLLNSFYQISRYSRVRARSPRALICGFQQRGALLRRHAGAFRVAGSVL